MPRAPQPRQQAANPPKELEQDQNASGTGDGDEAMDQTEQVEAEVDGYGMLFAWWQLEAKNACLQPRRHLPRH